MPERVQLCEGAEGYVEFAVGDFVKQVDIFEACNQLAAIQNEGDKPLTERHKDIVDYMVSLGFPPVSHYVAVRFSAEINRLSRELEKKVESTIESPAG